MSFAFFSLKWLESLKQTNNAIGSCASQDREQPDKSPVTRQYSAESLEQGSEAWNSLSKKPNRNRNIECGSCPRFFASEKWMLPSSIFKIFKFEGRGELCYWRNINTKVYLELSIYKPVMNRPKSLQSKFKNEVCSMHRALFVGTFHVFLCIWQRREAGSGEGERVLESIHFSSHKILSSLLSCLDLHFPPPPPLLLP